MQEFLERIGYERAWVGTTAVVAAAIALAAIAFPQRVYVDIIWQYYWAPVVADAQGWSCVAWDDGAQVQCGPETTGPTASPGYTWQSYAGYIPILLLLVAGIVLLLKRLDISRYRVGFYALIPFMLFGGALRVVEDASVAAGMLVPLPWAAFLISPFIYGTVFLIALIAVVIAVWLERSGHSDGYEYPLATMGIIAFGLTLAYLAYLAMTEPFATFYPLLLTAVVVGSILITAMTWWAISAMWPDIHDGTGLMGIFIIWAHALDGIANVIGLDWATSFGLPSNLTPKHPVNEWIVETTRSTLPQSVIEVTGAAWPFLFVKVAAAIVIIWLFNDEFFEESPRFAILLLITVVAVGLGPGTRDMLRATFGV